MSELILPFSSLSLLDSPCLEGKDKRVYKTTDGSKIMAAKLFKDIDSFGHAIAKEQRARAEFGNYQTLRNSHLRPYIPEPRYLLRDATGELSGLAVDWRTPRSLDNVDVRSGEVILSEVVLDNFQRAIGRVAREGVGLDLDMLSDWNIGFDSALIPPLYLFECQIYSVESLEDYLELIKRQFMYLKSLYCD